MRRTKADAEAFYNPEWIAGVTSRWGVMPTRSDWEVPQVVESVDGRVITDGTPCNGEGGLKLASFASTICPSVPSDRAAISGPAAALEGKEARPLQRSAWELRNAGIARRVRLRTMKPSGGIILRCWMNAGPPSPSCS